MKKPLLLILSMIAISVAGHGQLIINEISSEGMIEIKNNGNVSVDISSYWLGTSDENIRLVDSRLSCGTLPIAPDSFIVIENQTLVSSTDGSLGLSSSGDFSDPEYMVDYVEWGSAGHSDAATAIEAGIWQALDNAPAIEQGHSLEYDGNGEISYDWKLVSIPTPCAVNSSDNNCGATAASLIGGPYEFCIDGQDDIISDIIRTGGQGVSNRWVVTDQNHEVISVLLDQSAQDFEAIEIEHCFMWYITWNSLSGLAPGYNLSELTGCYSLSNPISVWQSDCESATSVEDFTREVKLSAYPNPAQDEVNLTWEKYSSKHTIAEIISSTGQVVLNQQARLNSNSMSIDVSALDAGYYYVVLKNEGAMQTTRLSVIR